ncbi:MAG TPA: hypothetical protein VN229_14105, partial [Terriglobales bacterium]|nr:hypothetical protein [Terriglobales bacterium]
MRKAGDGDDGSASRAFFERGGEGSQDDTQSHAAIIPIAAAGAAGTFRSRPETFAPGIRDDAAGDRGMSNPDIHGRG